MINIEAKTVSVEENELLSLLREIDWQDHPELLSAIRMMLAESDEDVRLTNKQLVDDVLQELSALLELKLASPRYYFPQIRTFLRDECKNQQLGILLLAKKLGIIDERISNEEYLEDLRIRQLKKQ